MGKTGIQWTDHSTNPICARDLETGAVGHWCEKISPGCKNCYASNLQKRFKMHEFVASNRNKVELFLKKERLQQVLKRRKPTKYFWCDMTDMFHPDVKDEWIVQCFATMAATPQHIHQVLTKRPERMAEFVNETHLPLGNVWLGISAEDQERYDQRIGHLLDCPPAVKFVSAEPLLERIDFHSLEDINWIIFGGESGLRARPCWIEWIQHGVKQCRGAGVAPFVKQFGARAIVNKNHPECEQTFSIDQKEEAAEALGEYLDHLYELDLNHPKGGDPSEWPEGDWPREFPSTTELQAAERA